MKAILILATLLLTTSSFAAEVKGAKLEGTDLKIDVAYGGGCKKHEFSLQVGGCAETFPVQCMATLKETVVNGPDNCEAYLQETVSISLAAAGITESYYNNGSLSIVGDNNTSATIKLPADVPSALKNGNNPSTPNSNPNNYVCQTGYIDCMPGLGDAKSGPDYCSKDYHDWHVANCGGGEPLIAY